MPSTSDLTRTLLRYCEPNVPRALFELAVTAIPLAQLWVLMRLSLDVGYWLTLLLAVPAAGFMVRLFIIQHDCGHGAFFRHRDANSWVGRVLGVLTLTPFDYWKRNHAIHHATSSNLDRRGIGDIELLTVEEYRSRSLTSRLLYRCYRNPIVMFVIGPAYMFFLQHRLPFRQMRDGWRPWISTMATNLAIALAVAGMIWLVGAKPFLMIHLPIMVMAASIESAAGSSRTKDSWTTDAAGQPEGRPAFAVVRKAGKAGFLQDCAIATGRWLNVRFWRKADTDGPEKTGIPAISYFDCFVDEFSNETFDESI
jgi:omega-6 fatty acid desaturase (delta-12 desaturase)